MVHVLERIAARLGVLDRVAGLPKIATSLDGLCRVLINRFKIEGQYLTKLEVKKGSDGSAIVATRRLIATSNQLKSMQPLLSKMHEAVVERAPASERESIFDSHPGASSVCQMRPIECGCAHPAMLSRQPHTRLAA